MKKLLSVLNKVIFSPGIIFILLYAGLALMEFCVNGYRLNLFNFWIIPLYILFCVWIMLSCAYIEKMESQLDEKIN